MNVLVSNAALEVISKEANDELISKGTRMEPGIMLDMDVWNEIQAKYSRQHSIKPLPRDQWPWWVVGISYFSTKEDKGVGDTVARTIGPFGGEAFRRWYKAWFGKDCGCGDRQQAWNARYPYGSNAS